MLNRLIESFRYYLQFNRMYSINTVESYVGDIAKFYQFVSNKKYSFDNLSIEHILEFLETSSHDRTRARILSSLKHFFYFIEDFENYEPHVELDDIKVKVRSIKIPTVLEVFEIEKIFACIVSTTDRQSIRDQAIFELLYSCGLRVSELVSLTLDRMDLQEGWINIIGKGNKERFVPIGDILMKKIKTYLEYSYPLYKTKKLGESYLFLTRLGKPLSRVMVWKLIKQYSALAGINRNVHPHTLRHTFATHLLSNGADLRAVQELLGHINLSTTKIYTHIKSTELRQVIDSYHPFKKRVE